MLFFLFRLINLTLLPIFNDEAIYLDWGHREIQEPGFLFYSLYDAKQPLLMWFFSLSMSIFQDPLFAGRFIGIVCGFIVMVGVYKLASQLFNKKYGVLASLVYIIIPIFSFYDRQALMESAMVAVGIWSSYYLIQLLKAPRDSVAVKLGLVFGLGYFIKSTALIFLLVTLLIFGYFMLKDRRVKQFLRLSGICLGVALSILLILFIQPLFWQTLASNSRYVLTPPELLTQPFSFWSNKLIATIKIVTFGLTPMIVLPSVLGVGYLWQSKIRERRALVIWFAIAFIIQFLFSRFTTPRYLAPFLPLSIIFLMACYYHMFGKIKLAHGLLLSLLVIPLLLTTYQVLSPYSYLKSISLGLDEGYLEGQTSGYGIQETVDFLRARNSPQPIFVATHLNAGNPESAVIVYFRNDPRITTGYFEATDLGDIKEIDCVKIDKPLYYVTRREEIGELRKYFDKVMTISRSSDTYTIGIYKLREGCSGRRIQLNAIRT